MAWRTFKLDNGQSIHWISVDVFRTLQSKQDFLIVDVSDVDEYLKDHIPEAKFVDDCNFMQFVYEHDKSQSILLYCPNGPKSKFVAMRLSYYGFKTIYCLEGGFNQWRL